MRNDVLTTILEQANRQPFRQSHFIFLIIFFACVGFRVNVHFALDIFSCPISYYNMIVQITYLIQNIKHNNNLHPANH